ncbi:MAG TPA: hypothetical protein VGH16_02765 [Candidatus Binatia bacterium]|jgi:rRNA maturation endonuclease Nob1
MPDRGKWTLRCQNCQKDFQVVVKPGERLSDFARYRPCPRCGTKPDDVSDHRSLGTWHHVIDFRSIKEPT